MKKKFCRPAGIAITFLLPGMYFSVHAQTRALTGIVNDGTTPLSGVTVAQDGSDQMTTTSSSGAFTLQLTGSNPVLIFRHPEYQEQKVTVGDRTTVVISLAPKEKTIQEVVLNAGYYTVKAKESTGSIAKVSGKDIENQPVGNVLSAVQGRIPGVTIVQNSGVPGGGFDIQIRGKNSLRSYSTRTGFEANVPLYIVDGVILSQGNEFKSGLSPGILVYQDTNPLSFLNPNDIESIEILKDADATAIYGSRGANGVILISTKKGKKGKTSVQLNSSYALGEVANLPEMMSTEQYIAMRKKAFANDGITSYPANAYDVNGVWEAAKNTDWQKYFVGGHSERSSNDIRLSLGSSSTQFMFTAGHDEETTIFPGDYRYKKTKVGLNVGHQSPDQKLRLQLSSFYTLQNNYLPPTDFMRVYPSLSPNAPDLFNADGSLNWQNSTFNNPMAAATQDFKSNQKQLLSSLNLSYRISKGLAFQMNAGYTNDDQLDRRIFPKTFYNPVLHYGSEKSSVLRANTQSSSWLFEPQLNYHWEKINHQLDLLTGMTFQHQNTNFEMISASNFPSDDMLENIGAAAISEVKAFGDATYRYTAGYGRINYQYKKRYILNVTGRRDGSSRFGPGNRFATFGALGAAWIFSKEPFFKDSSWLSFGNFRASYGTAGSDNIGNYQFYDTYAKTGVSYENTPAFNPIRLYNPNYGWEITKKLELAVETAFFHDHISFLAAYYRHRSGNQLVGVPLPTLTGFTSVQANLNAVVENTGWEFTLAAKPFTKADFSWDTSLNLSIPKNKLLSFPDLEGSSYSSFLVIGKSMVLKKMYHYLGVNPQTGIYEFEDVNSDGKLDVNDRVIVKELGINWYGGFQNNLRYKNWSLDVLTQISSQTRENILALSSTVGTIGNLPVEFLDYWTTENTTAEYQRPSTGANAALNAASSNLRISDATISDSFYIRLKNVQLNYKLPSPVLRHLDANLFLMGQNLWSWTNFQGLDPEYTLSGYTPPLRVWSFGFTLTF